MSTIVTTEKSVTVFPEKSPLIVERSVGRDGDCLTVLTGDHTIRIRIPTHTALNDYEVTHKTVDGWEAI